MRKRGVSVPSVFLLCSLALVRIAAQPHPQPLVFPSETGDAAFGDSNADFIKQTWKVEHGLPHNIVQALLQTRDGYLWIGTRAGVARFDGLKFTVFNRANVSSMVGDDCRFLAEDLEGNVWAGTENGLLRFGQGRCTRFSVADGLRDNEILALYVARDGTLWIGTHTGVNRFRNGQFVSYLRDDNDWMVSFYESPDGTLWLGSLGLHRYDPRTDQFRPAGVYPPSRDTQHYERTGVRGMHVDSQGNLWACFNNLVQRSQDNLWTHHLRLHWNKVWQKLVFFTDHDGSLWMNAGSRGLCRFRDQRFKFYSAQEGFSEEQLLCFLLDREGNFWLGTDPGGLKRWRPRQVMTITAENGLPDNNVWSLCENQDGEVWIGTATGLAHYKDGEIRIIAGAEGITNTRIRSIYESLAGEVWVGSDEGLLRFPERNFSAAQNLPALRDSGPRALLQDRKGLLWIGTENGLYRTSDSDLTQVVPIEGLQDVRAMLEDRSGAMWVALNGGGLRRLNPEGTQAFTKDDGLASNRAWSLLEDRQGVIWIGTEHGLSRFEEGRLASFTTREGLAENLVNYVLEDDSGHLWISGKRAIYRIEKQRLNNMARGAKDQPIEPIAFGLESSGALLTEATGQRAQPGAFRDRDGRLWFPTTRGIVVIDPKRVTINAVAPPVVLERVVSGHRVVFDDGSFGPEASKEEIKLRVEDEIVLPPGGGHSLDFYFTANGLTAPQSLRFRYRLEGYDKDWRDAGTRRTAHYTGLKPGHYGFRVTACNEHWKWHETGAFLPFHVQPHFYQTWTFRLGGSLAALLSVSLAYRWRVGELRKIQRLERERALAVERARIAKDLHDELGANVTRFSMLAELALRDLDSPEKASEHLQKISGSAGQFSRTLKEIIWSADPSCDTVEGFVIYVCKYADEFLSSAGIRTRYGIAEDLPEAPLKVETRHQLFMVVKEALNNVAKHASAQEVWIRADASAAELTLEIEDRGLGFDASRLSAPRPGAMGQGLQNMDHRIRQLGGEFSIKTQPSIGTRIRFTIPIVQGVR